MLTKNSSSRVLFGQLVSRFNYKFICISSYGLVAFRWLFILQIGPRNEEEGTDEEKGSRVDFVICKDRKSVDIMLDVGRIV